MDERSNKIIQRGGVKRKKGGKGKKWRWKVNGDKFPGHGSKEKGEKERCVPVRMLLRPDFLVPFRRRSMASR